MSGLSTNKLGFQYKEKTAKKSFFQHLFHSLPFFNALLNPLQEKKGKEES